MKKITILGATGSIGLNTLDIVRKNRDKFSVYAVTADKSYQKLKEIVDEFSPDIAVLNYYPENFSYSGKTEWYFGKTNLISLSKQKVDILVNSLVGTAGLEPTYNAILAGSDIALANKESLVIAGKLIMEASKEKKVKIMPIDSEHSALFQLISDRESNEINKIILTASGGPFRTLDINEFDNITLQDALKHPTWNMGKKITIDSATLMNKGFEVIEAMWFFKKNISDIDVVIHPQSIIHSMIELIDGTILAHMGLPDMRIPIQYALSYPERWDFKHNFMDFTKINNLTFEIPDLNKFPCLKYAYDTAKIGESAYIVLNRANEEAVYAFLDNKIKFTDISKIINYFLEKHKVEKITSIEQVFFIDDLIKNEVRKYIEGIKL